jgi:hypothetical protein
MRVSALVTAFEMELARAIVDAFTQPSQVLHDRIRKIEQCV